MLVPEVVAVAVPDVRTPTPAGVPLIVGLVSVGVVSVTLDAICVVPTAPATILDDPTDAGLFGIAFNTELTRKLSVTTASPTVQALARTTVVPVVAV
jgi:hypothetical protein